MMLHCKVLHYSMLNDVLLQDVNLLATCDVTPYKE